MPAWPRNLKQAVEQYGTPAATGPVVALIDHAFHLHNTKQQQERLKERGTLDKQAMYISDFGSECLRQLYFSRTNEPKTNPLTTDSLMNFMVGHAVEESVATLLEWLGCDVVREFHIKLILEELEGKKNLSDYVTGRADFLIDLPVKVLKKLKILENIQGRGLPPHMLLELKATSSKAMIAMIVNGEAGKEGHRHQLNGYLHASQLGLVTPSTGRIDLSDGAENAHIEPRAYDVGYLCYIIKDASKGMPNIFAFRVEYDEKMILSDLEVMAYVETIASKKEDPGIPTLIEAKAEKNRGKAPVWPCGYCSWEDRCWRQKDEA